MTLTQLEAFVLVARLGSVKAAARVLGVSEPAVSASLASLRRHFADPLIVRANGRMDLTPGGRRLVPIASQMVSLAAEAGEAMRGAHGAPEQLRVVATSTVAEYVARPLLTAFASRVGAVEVSLGVTTAREMPALLEDRLADVGLGPRLGGFDSAPVLRHRLVVVAGPRHALVGARRVSGERSPRRLAGGRERGRSRHRGRRPVGPPAHPAVAGARVPELGGRVGGRRRVTAWLRAWPTSWAWTSTGVGWPCSGSMAHPSI